MSSPTRLPTVFLGHGNPMNTLWDNQYTQAWRALGESVPAPKAILCVSAHWYLRGTKVTAMLRPRTIHDFGGFPRELNEFQYPAPGNPALAERVKRILAPLDVELDRTWGLDHGTWSVLTHAYPNADIAIVQISIDAFKPASFHYELGQRLAPLRDEGVLIVGSGNVVHNLGACKFYPNAEAYDWAERFERFARDLISASDHRPLVDYLSLGTDAELSIPTPDHYLPLLYVLGAQQEGESVRFLVEGIEHGAISMLAMAIN